MHHNDSYLMHWFSPSGAQLNVFYEVLSSVNYKGSMTSLQSAFSSNSSAASSVQSRWYESKEEGAATSGADMMSSPLEEPMETDMLTGTLIEKSVNLSDTLDIFF